MPIDKRQLYDFDLRVPLIVRGPGVAKNVTRNEPMLNIDIAPTILDIANGSNGHFPQAMDGMSFLSLLQVCFDLLRNLFGSGNRFFDKYESLHLLHYF